MTRPGLEKLFLPNLKLDAWGACVLAKTGREKKVREEWDRYQVFLRNREHPFMARSEVFVTAQPPRTPSDDTELPGGERRLDNSGVLTSPPISLKGAAEPVLIFKEWSEVEDVTFNEFARAQVRAGGNKWDTLYESHISTSIDPLNWQQRVTSFGWNLSLESDLSTPQWVPRSFQLSAYAGKTIQVRFSFDSADGLFNQYEGWHVDDFNVFSFAKPAPSTTLLSAPTPQGVSSVRIASTWSLINSPTGGDEPVAGN